MSATGGSADARPFADRSLMALAALNFFLADARDGLGPFLDAYLITHGWSPFDLGVLATIGGLVGLAAGAPAGALVDSSRHKRLLVIVPIVIITALAFAAIAWPVKAVVFGGQLATALAGLTIGPAVMAITLGIAGRASFADRVSGNEVWNHAGNIVLLAGTYGMSRAFGLGGVAALMAVTTVAAILACLAIDPRRIDHATARGLAADSGKERPSSLSLLVGDRRLLLFAAALMMFHFGNAPIGRLIAQQFALEAGKPFQTTAIITIVGQISAIVGAFLAPRLVARIGLRALILIALLSLPIRGVIAWNGGGFSMVYRCSCSTASARACSAS